MASKTLQVAPFDGSGNLLDYTGQTMGKDLPMVEGSVGIKWGEPGYVFCHPGVYWRPRDPFRETLTVKKMDRGRSSVVIAWYNEKGARFPMFASDFMELLLRGDLGAGVPGLTISGMWQVRKSGSNYGIALLAKDA